MRKLFPFLILLCWFGPMFSQALLNNNGANIYVKDGAFMIVKTYVPQPASLSNNLNSGLCKIDNQGTIVVEGDIKNNALINGSGDTIRLKGDWINNNAYTTNNSWVDMYGASQLITGTAITTFDNLNLGGGAVVKRQTINSITSNLLQLNDAELATDTNEMWVSTPNTAAITWNNGFVSSLDSGKLSRSTNSTNPYVFPLGSPSYDNPPSIFRPIQMSPAGNGADIFSACVVKGDATNFGDNINSLDSLLCKVNPNFFHRLYHGTGTDATDLTMYFDPSTDGTWTDEAHWKNGVWNYIAPSVAGTGLGFSTVTVPGVSDFSPKPFALAIKKFQLIAGPGDSINPGQSVVLNPTIGAPAGSTIMWTPDTALSCNTCANPTATPIVTTEYTITVIDPLGCTVSDSLRIAVSLGGFAMPDAFTPNGDGKNDLFGPVTLRFFTIKGFRIYNRWGQLVHNSIEPWDGKFNGKEQPAGTYLYYIQVQFPDPTNPDVESSKSQEGTVTLLR